MRRDRPGRRARPASPTAPPPTRRRRAGGGAHVGASRSSAHSVSVSISGRSWPGLLLHEGSHRPGVDHAKNKAKRQAGACARGAARPSAHRGRVRVWQFRDKRGCALRYSCGNSVQQCVKSISRPSFDIFVNEIRLVSALQTLTRYTVVTFTLRWSEALAPALHSAPSRRYRIASRMLRTAQLGQHLKSGA